MKLICKFLFEYIIKRETTLDIKTRASFPSVLFLIEGAIRRISQRIERDDTNRPNCSNKSIITKQILKKFNY
jgi:hypothetical protein